MVLGLLANRSSTDCMQFFLSYCGLTLGLKVLTLGLSRGFWLEYYRSDPIYVCGYYRYENKDLFE